MRTIFEAGALNKDGICASTINHWISLALGGTEVKTRSDLGSVAAIKSRWQQATDNDDIDNVYNLVAKDQVNLDQDSLDITRVAHAMTRGAGYFRFSCWGRVLNTSTGKWDESGHSMGTRKGTRKGGFLQPMQFFDPNLGLLEFDNTLEFYDFLLPYVMSTYPSLMRRSAEIRRY